MSKLYVSVGLPASAKTTYAKNYLENVVVLSSDDLREELLGDVGDQSDNQAVFDELFKRAKNFLKAGADVFIDATNISSKRRKHIVQEFRKHADKLIAVYFDTPYEECLLRNNVRQRWVPEHVITRMYKTLQIPTYAEGWDEIGIVTANCYNDVLHMVRTKEQLEDIITDPEMTYEQLMSHLTQSKAFARIYELAQDNPHHTFTVSRHTYYVWKNVVEDHNHEDYYEDELAMIWSALFHDTGKAFCKEFVDGKRYASFIGHENVSAQLACHVLSNLGYSTDFILKVVELVQNHMKLLSIGDSNKGKKKLLDFVGEDVYNKLVRLREADVSAK